MALSNLIWWPWFGKGAEEPVVGGEMVMGGREVGPIPGVRTRPVMHRLVSAEEEDDIEFILYLLTVT